MRRNPPRRSAHQTRDANVGSLDIVQTDAQMRKRNDHQDQERRSDPGADSRVITLAL